MDTTFSASHKAKSASGTTPFEQIRAAEAAESARVQKELDFFARKQQETVKQMRETEEKEEHEIRETATTALKEFREKEMPKLLGGSDQKAKKACADLEAACASKEAGAVSALVQKVTSSNFLATAA
jgi:hypothetical protein